MPIRVLPDEVASAIAAGEVIERPASVVKELVENSIDAASRTISIRTAGAGVELIEVIDDGEGIPAGEISLAVARHATSKLKSSSDLEQIKSLGFRGEALASIASVSRFQLTSRTVNATLGARVKVEAGGRPQVEAMGGAAGTTVQVRDLFFNLPARRAFLKSETTERRHIKDWVTRYALAYPGIQFSLQEHDRQLLKTPGQDDRLQVLAEMFGVDRARSMLQLPELPDTEITVGGFISPPSVTRSNRKELTFFVNGRWIQDASLAAAVLQAYQGLLMVGRYPYAVLFLEMHPQALDVNVHPAKAEVRFRDRRLAFSTVQRAVRATLLRQSPPPQVVIDARWPTAAERGAEAAVPGSLWRELGTTTDGGLAGEHQAIHPPLAGSAGVPLLRAVGQVGAAYLVAEGPDGIYLIDQHAAHERVLFERLMRAINEGRNESQGLLEAVTVELEGGQAELLEAQMPTLIELGFEVEPFGRASYRVRAIPALLSNLSPENALRAVVEDFEEDEAPLEQEIRSLVAARVCKRAAIKAGQVLSLQEQRELVGDLERCGSPRTCPHGRPTLVHLSVDSLERQFGRRG